MRLGGADTVEITAAKSAIFTGLVWDLDRVRDAARALRHLQDFFSAHSGQPVRCVEPRL